MNKGKRAFTITELVVVIAVIAILAAVLIPTFANLVKEANESVALQEARSEWSNFSVEVAANDPADNDYLLVHSDGKETPSRTCFAVIDNQFQVEPVSLSDQGESDVEGGVYTGAVFTVDAVSYTVGDVVVIDGYVTTNQNVTIYKLIASGS